MVSDHGTLITVEGNGRVVERFLRMSKVKVELGDAAFEDAPEIPRD